jgi:four helix bundle protein
MTETARRRLGECLLCHELNRRPTWAMESSADGPPYRQLKAWAESRDLAVLIYRLCVRRTKTIDRGLADQIRRAAISIPSNVAEGNGRGTNRDSLRFLYIARGSLCELESQIDVCLRAGLIETGDSRNITDQLALVGRLIGGLISYRKSRPD